MTLFDQFIKDFGKWSVAKACKIEDLPFIIDIKRFLDEVEADNIENIFVDSADNTSDPI